MFGSTCWVSLTLKTDARKVHFWNGCTQGSLRIPMRATRKAILTDSDARNRLLGNGCAQGMGQIPDACNLHPGMRTTPLTYPITAHLSICVAKIQGGLAVFSVVASPAKTETSKVTCPETVSSSCSIRESCVDSGTKRNGPDSRPFFMF